MHYVAGKRMEFPGDLFLEPGDRIPDVHIANWRNLRAAIDQRRVLVVHDPEGEPSTTAPGPKPAEPILPPEPTAALTAVEALELALADPKNHTKAALLKLAKAAGLTMPARRPRNKAGLITTLAELAGFEV